MKKHQHIAEREPMIGISTKDRQLSIEVLNGVLSDEFIILTQTLNYHWNLVGPQFYDYHKLFDVHYHELFDFLDIIAERIRAIGGIACASMFEILKNTSLKEDTGDIPRPTDMVDNLLQQHEMLIREIRKGIDSITKDMGTNNFLTDLLEKHEKIAWMLRSLLI